MILKGGEVFWNGRLRKADIDVQDGVIAGIGDFSGMDIDCRGCLILPIFADIHTHGCLGIDFTNIGQDDMGVIEEYYLSHGVGYFLPTLISSAKGDYKAMVQGLSGRKVRLEGPFFGTKRCGAHDPSCLGLPDYDMIAGLGDSVAMVDIDPTLAGSLELIARLERQGIKTSIGHTDATYQQAMAAFGAGCRHVTHLFNAMESLHHRESGVIGAAFDHPDVMVELICDGYHISPTVLRMAFRLFDGRICIISDGHRLMGVQEDGCACLEDGTIAGAVMGIERTVFALESWGIPLEKAVYAAAVAPCAAMGIKAPEIAANSKAAFGLFRRGEKKPLKVFCGSRII